MIEPDYRHLDNVNLNEQYCGHEPKSNSLAYCDKYNNIVAVEEKLNDNVNLMKFRKIVIDGNLLRLPDTQQGGRNSCFLHKFL